MLTLITLLVTVIDIRNKISRISIYWKISEDVLKYNAISLLCIQVTRNTNRINLD